MLFLHQKNILLLNEEKVIALPSILNFERESWLDIAEDPTFVLSFANQKCYYRGIPPKFLFINENFFL